MVININSNNFYSNTDAGIYFYSNKYFAGLSVFNITQTILNNNRFTDNNLRTIAIAGYKASVTSHFDAEPSILFRHLTYSGIPLNRIDINLKCYYRRNNNFKENIIWIGISAGSYLNGISQPISLGSVAGSSFGSHYFFIYAYEYTASGIMPYTYGTHQITIGIYFNKKLKYKCPAFL